MPASAPGSVSFDAVARQYMRQETPLPYGQGAQDRIISPVGLLSRITLRVTGNIVLTLSGGGTAVFKKRRLWEVFQRIQLTTNNNINLIDATGFGMFLVNLLQDRLYDPSGDSYPGAATQVGDLNSQPRTSWYSEPALVTGNNAIAFTLLLPVAINDADPIGLIMLQNRRTVVTLRLTYDNPLATNTITLTAGTGVATEGTHTLSTEITTEYFTVPDDEATWPDLLVVHKITEDAIALANTGEVTYDMPLDNTYMRMWQQVTCNGAPSDAIDYGKIKVNVADDLYNLPRGLWQQLTFRRLGVVPPVGCYLWDWYYQGTPNLNNGRDLIDSRKTAQLQAITAITSGTTIAAGDTIRNIREELVQL